MSTCIQKIFFVKVYRIYNCKIIFSTKCGTNIKRPSACTYFNGRTYASICNSRGYTLENVKDWEKTITLSYYHRYIGEYETTRKKWNKWLESAFYSLHFMTASWLPTIKSVGTSTLPITLYKTRTKLFLTRLKVFYETPIACHWRWSYF